MAIGLLGAAGLTLLGGAMQGMFQDQTNRANQGIASDQMNFQERMSNTSHQREVADMRAAGLNPILSGMGGSGASSPNGASIAQQNPVSSNILADSVSSAIDARRLRKEIEGQDSQTKLNEASAAAAAASRAQSEASAKKIATENKAIEAQMPAIIQKAKTDTKREKFNEKAAEYDSIMSRVKQGTGIITDAASAFMPKIRIGGQTKEVYIDKNTGEILK